MLSDDCRLKKSRIQLQWRRLLCFRLKSVLFRHFLNPVEREVSIFFFHNEKESTLDLRSQIKHERKKKLEPYCCIFREKTEPVMIQLYAGEFY